MLIPEFSEDLPQSMFLYFAADGDIQKMYGELEKTYVCFEKMNTVTKNGKKYVVLEIKNEE